MTYSIVARDPDTGELGVGVQTCMFAVGTIVPWAKPGIGAVATQAFAEAAYGWRCLEQLDQGRTAEEALDAARAVDPGSAIRQVGVVDAQGRAASFTGASCIDHAGNQLGVGYTVQGNMLTSPDVWPAMAAAFEGTSGPLTERLLAALCAGEAEGGDARGRLSAALLVVDGQPHEHPGEGVLVDLRVDHHDAPLDELARLLDARGAFDAGLRSYAELMDGQPDAAVASAAAALARLPDDENFRFAHGIATVLAGDIGAGRSELRALVAARPSWATIIRSFAAQGLLTLPGGVTVDSLLA